MERREKSELCVYEKAVVHQTPFEWNARDSAWRVFILGVTFVPTSSMYIYIFPILRHLYSMEEVNAIDTKRARPPEKKNRDTN